MALKRKLLLALLFLSIFFVSIPLKYVFAGNPPDAAHSTLVATSAGSDTAPADGSTTTSMTVTLHDSGDVALVGDTVNLSIPLDGSAVISPPSQTTDGSGQAVFTITSTNVGTDSIDVVDSTTSTTLTALGQVTFTAVQSSGGGGGNSSSSSSSGPPQCSNQMPTHTPDLYQINNTSTTATLFFAPPNDSFDGFTITYGLSQSADTYSAHFQQGSTGGAISYTINALLPNVQYYFKVRADNGCAPGPFSDVKASAHGTKLPATGPTNIFWIGLGGVATFLAGALVLFI